MRPGPARPGRRGRHRGRRPPDRLRGGQRGPRRGARRSASCASPTTARRSPGRARSRGAWTRTTPVSRFGRTFRLFGHSAPASAMVPRDNAAVPGGISWSLHPTDYSLPDSSRARARRARGRHRDRHAPAGRRRGRRDDGGHRVGGARPGRRRSAGLTDTVTLLSITPAIPAAPTGATSPSTS